MKPIIQVELDKLQRQIDELRRSSGGVTEVFHDGTLSGKGTKASRLSADPLSGTIDARFADLSGTIDARFAAALGLSLLDIRVFTGSVAYVPTSGTTALRVRMAGAGGGGGGCNVASGSFSSAGGGAGGAYWEKFFPELSSSTGSISVGAGGAGGASSGGTQAAFNGSTGGDSSFAINGTTYVAGGGVGGSGSMGSNINFSNFRAGGYVRASSTGDVVRGEAGGESILKTYSGDASTGTTYAGPSGRGGSGPFGTGGDWVMDPAGGTDGRAGTGRGSGGSGAAGVDDGFGTGDGAGGAGANGLVIVEEYADGGAGGGGGGSGLSGVEHDGTLTGDGTAGSPLSASPLSGTCAATDGYLDGRMTALSGSVDGHFSQLSGTVNSRFSHLSGVIDARFRSRANIWDPPDSPHEWDDEFNGPALSASWQVLVNSGSTFSADAIDPYAQFSTGAPRVSHNYMRKSWFMMQGPAHQATEGIFRNLSGSVPANMFFWTRCSFNSRRVSGSAGANDYSIGIMLAQNDAGNGNIPARNTDNVRFFINENDTGVSQYEAGSTSGGVNRTGFLGIDIFNTQMDLPSYQAIGIQKLDTRYHFWVMNGGGSAVHLGWHDWTGSLDHVLLFHYNFSTLDPGNMIVGWDFVRFVTGTWLP